MKPLIYVRRYDEKVHGAQMKEVIKSYVLSKFKTAFIFCLFREVWHKKVILSVLMFN